MPTLLPLATPTAACDRCGATIGFTPPEAGVEASAWTCQRCNSVFFGGGDDLAGNVGLSSVRDDGTFALEPLSNPGDSRGALMLVEQATRLIDSLIAEKYLGEERRKHTRYPVAVPVIAIPLTSELRVFGESQEMTTIDVSLGGAALFHKRVCDAPYLALDFTSAGLSLLQIVLRVCRTSRIGLLHVVAGEFVSKLSSPGR